MPPGLPAALQGVPPFRCIVRIRPALPSDKDPICIEWDEDEGNVTIESSTINREYIGFPLVVPPGLTQDEAFRRMDVENLVTAALHGYNATILAYGQTSSGKTHTVIGSTKALDGILPQALSKIFDRKVSENINVKIRASFIEVGNAPGLTNEVITDLLEPSKVNLPIRYNEKREPVIADLTTVECETSDDAIMVLQEGAKYRRTSSTKMNERSSRSHSVFCLYLDLVDEGKYAKFQFVDLAGSERVKTSGADGQTLKEAQTINKSLFTLAQVILALQPGQKKGHVPYRNAKITELLSDSFGGNAYCMMVTCINPTSTDETNQTLQYATRAMAIENRPIANKAAAQAKSAKAAHAEYIAEQKMMAEAQAGLADENTHLKEELEAMKAEHEEMMEQMREEMMMAQEQMAMGGGMMGMGMGGMGMGMGGMPGMPGGMPGMMPGMPGMMPGMGMPGMPGGMPGVANPMMNPMMNPMLAMQINQQLQTSPAFQKLLTTNPMMASTLMSNPVMAQQFLAEEEGSEEEEAAPEPGADLVKMLTENPALAKNPALVAELVKQIQKGSKDKAVVEEDDKAAGASLEPAPKSAKIVDDVIVRQSSGLGPASRRTKKVVGAVDFGAASAALAEQLQAEPEPQVECYVDEVLRRKKNEKPKRPSVLSDYFNPNPPPPGIGGGLGGGAPATGPSSGLGASSGLGLSTAGGVGQVLYDNDDNHFGSKPPPRQTVTAKPKPKGLKRMPTGFVGKLPSDDEKEDSKVDSAWTADSGPVASEKLSENPFASLMKSQNARSRENVVLGGSARPKENIGVSFNASMDSTWHLPPQGASNFFGQSQQQRRASFFDNLVAGIPAPAGARTQPVIPAGLQTQGGRQSYFGTGGVPAANRAPKKSVIGGGGLANKPRSPSSAGEKSVTAADFKSVLKERQSVRGPIPGIGSFLDEDDENSKPSAWKKKASFNNLSFDEDTIGASTSMEVPKTPAFSSTAEPSRAMDAAAYRKSIMARQGSMVPTLHVDPEIAEVFNEKPLEYAGASKSKTENPVSFSTGIEASNTPLGLSIQKTGRESVSTSMPLPCAPGGGGGTNMPNEDPFGGFRGAGPGNITTNAQETAATINRALMAGHTIPAATLPLEQANKHIHAIHGQPLRKSSLLMINPGVVVDDLANPLPDTSGPSRVIDMQSVEAQLPHLQKPDGSVWQNLNYMGRPASPGSYNGPYPEIAPISALGLGSDFGHMLNSISSQKQKLAKLIAHPNNTSSGTSSNNTEGDSSYLTSGSATSPSHQEEGPATIKLLGPAGEIRIPNNPYQEEWPGVSPPDAPVQDAAFIHEAVTRDEHAKLLELYKKNAPTLGFPRMQNIDPLANNVHSKFFKPEDNRLLGKTGKPQKDIRTSSPTSRFTFAVEQDHAHMGPRPPNSKSPTERSPGARTRVRKESNASTSAGDYLDTQQHVYTQAFRYDKPDYHLDSILETPPAIGPNINNLLSEVARVHNPRSIDLSRQLDGRVSLFSINGEMGAKAASGVEQANRPGRHRSRDAEHEETPIPESADIKVGSPDRARELPQAVIEEAIETRQRLVQERSKLYSPSAYYDPNSSPERSEPALQSSKEASKDGKEPGKKGDKKGKGGDQKDGKGKAKKGEKSDGKGDPKGKGDGKGGKGEKKGFGPPPPGSIYDSPAVSLDNVFNQYQYNNAMNSESAHLHAKNVMNSIKPPHAPPDIRTLRTQGFKEQYQKRLVQLEKELSRVQKAVEGKEDVSSDDEKDAKGGKVDNGGRGGGGGGAESGNEQTTPNTGADVSSPSKGARGPNGEQRPSVVFREAVDSALVEQSNRLLELKKKEAEIITKDIQGFLSKNIKADDFKHQKIGDLLCMQNHVSALDYRIKEIENAIRFHQSQYEAGAEVKPAGGGGASGTGATGTSLASSAGATGTSLAPLAGATGKSAGATGTGAAVSGSTNGLTNTGPPTGVNSSMVPFTAGAPPPLPVGGTIPSIVGARKNTGGGSAGEKAENPLQSLAALPMTVAKTNSLLTAQNTAANAGTSAAATKEHTRESV